MAIISTHPPLSFAFGLLGNIISVLVFLAPVPTFIRIYRKKSTEGFHCLPYSVALFSCMLWLHYAMLKTDTFLLVTINAFGCVIETIYILLFIIYASKQTRVSTFKLLASLNIALFSFIVLFTHFLMKGSIRVQVLGWINVTVAVSVFAAPLSIVAQVIRTKSVEFMPFNLSFFLTLSAVMWFGYGLTKKDMCIALPNILGFILGLVQMVLYAIYRKAQNVIMEEKFPEQLKTIVILSSEVHPDPVKPEPQPESESESKSKNEKNEEEEKEEENKKNDEEKNMVKSDEDLNKSELAV